MFLWLLCCRLYRFYFFFAATCMQATIYTVHVLRNITDLFTARDGNLRSTLRILPFILDSCYISQANSVRSLWHDSCYLLWFILALYWWAGDCPDGSEAHTALFDQMKPFTEMLFIALQELCPHCALLSPSYLQQVREAPSHSHWNETTWREIWHWERIEEAGIHFVCFYLLELGNRWVNCAARPKERQLMFADARYAVRETHKESFCSSSDAEWRWV